MADVRGATAFGGRADTVAPLRPRPRAAVTALGELEAKRAGYGVGFRQPQREPLADTIGFARLVAHELTRRLVVAEIFLAERLGEDETVAAEVLDRGPL